MSNASAELERRLRGVRRREIGVTAIRLVGIGGFLAACSVALVQSERLHDELFTNCPEVTTMGRVVQVKPLAERTYGVENIAIRLRDSKGDPRTIYISRRSFVSVGAPVRVTYRQRADGEIRVTSTEVLPSAKSDGALSGLE